MNTQDKGEKKIKKIGYFGTESQYAQDAWTGGLIYKHLLAFELFGFKLEFWKKYDHTKNPK